MQSSRKRPRTHRFDDAAEGRLALREAPRPRREVVPPTLRASTRSREDGDEPGDDADEGLTLALGMAIESLELLRQAMTEAESSEATEEPTLPYDIYPATVYPTTSVLPSSLAATLESALEDALEDGLEDAPGDATPLHLAAIRSAAHGLFEARAGAAGFALSEAEWLLMLRQRYCA